MNRLLAAAFVVLLAALIYVSYLAQKGKLPAGQPQITQPQP
jgi:hypothetical protein